MKGFAKCIGGPKDGETVRIPDEVPVLRVENSDRTAVFYDRMHLGAEGEAIPVFVFRGISSFEAIKRLVANYGGAENDRDPVSPSRFPSYQTSRVALEEQQRKMNLQQEGVRLGFNQSPIACGECD